MKNSYIKSPLNYTGGKHKLLPQILPLFPTEINTFVDLFTGGGNIAVNVNANKIIAIAIKRAFEYFAFISEIIRLRQKTMPTNDRICIR